MSNVYVIGDLHFGHKNICNYRKIEGVNTEEEHRMYLVKQWNAKITKRDKIYVLGDAAFTEEGFESIKLLNGNKILVRGNHDVLPAAKYLESFSDVCGFVRVKAAWLSHAPIHPEELRGKICIHGHVHNATIQDRRYRNVSVENCPNHQPVNMHTLIQYPSSVLVNYPD